MKSFILPLRQSALEDKSLRVQTMTLKALCAANLNF